MKCYFCDADGAIMQSSYIVLGKPCCPICKQTLELCKQFAKTKEAIGSSFGLFMRQLGSHTDGQSPQQ